MLTVILIAATALLVAADQLSKLWAVTALRGQPPIPLWPGVFELEYRENTGVAFSLLEGQSWVFIPLTLIVMILFIVLLWRSDFRRFRTFRAAAVLIVAGGVGNLIDRIRLRYVVDFLYFKLIDFPIFNVADICVCVGAALLFIFLLFIYKEPEGMGWRTMLFGGRPQKTADAAEQSERENDDHAG